jgi:hypothetical protein
LLSGEQHALSWLPQSDFEPDIAALDDIQNSPDVYRKAAPTAEEKEVAKQRQFSLEAQLASLPSSRTKTQ